MKYGFTIPGSGPLADPEVMSAVARRGEELGYHFLASPDHVVMPRKIDSPYPYSESRAHPGSAAGAAMEQLTVLAFLAGQTRTLRLVASVMIVPHRNPVVAAKALATLDVLSHGRLTVGVGVGWMREEFEALNLPPFEERGAVTDEFIRAFKELWTSDNPTFQGKYCRFSNISFLPKPVQKPHPPIWVGGESRRAMSRTAQLADGWCPLGSNSRFPMGTPELLDAGIKRLAAHLERAGRRLADVDVAYRVQTFELTKDGTPPASPQGERSPFSGSAAQIASDIRRYQEMGVSQLVVDFAGVASSTSGDPEQVMRRMEELATQVWPQV